MKDFQERSDPRMNEAMWRAQDLLRAYTARDRDAVTGHLAHLEADQLDYAAGVLVTMYNATGRLLADNGRPLPPQSVVREVEGLARFTPAEHTFAVTTVAPRLVRGEVTMQEVVDAMDVHDRIHTMAVYNLALQLAAFSRTGVQRALDQAAAETTALGHPRPYSME